LTGAIKQRPREDRALQKINGTIGALGKLYVEIPVKQRKAEMIQNIILAYQNRISNLTWMSETKQKPLKN
jgi:endothelin-converting enzyme/putative endopeptidase